MNQINLLKNKKVILSLLVSLFLVIGGKVWGQTTLFQQNFSSSTTVSDYVSAMPNIGQFNAIGSSGAGTVLSINGGELQFARTGNAGAFSRTTDFSPTPTTMIYKFDLTITGNTAAQTTAAAFQIGSGFGTANSNEANANTYARLGINFMGTNGTFQLRSQDGSPTNTTATNSVNLVGKQTITWVLNNSGVSKNYTTPLGTSEAIPNDRMVVWAGTTKLFGGDVPVLTAAQNMTDLKFYFNNGTGTIRIGNILITTIPEEICETPPSFDFFKVEADGDLMATLDDGFEGTCELTGYGFQYSEDPTFATGITTLEGDDVLYADGELLGAINVSDLACGNKTFYFRAFAENGEGTRVYIGSSTDKITTAACPTFLVLLNAGTGEVDGEDEYEDVASVVLPLAIPPVACDNWTFIGWTEEDNIAGQTTEPATLYAAGTTFVPTDETMLYAVYGKKESSRGESIIATVGFDTGEDFTNGSTYSNNVTPKNDGPTGKQWAFLMGTPSTTTPISGTMSAQMRSYAPASGSYAGSMGSVTMLYDLKNVTKVTYKALASTAGKSLNLYYSTNGGSSWSTATPQAVSNTTATEYEYIISTTGEYENVRIKFEHPTINLASQMRIDDVDFYGMANKVVTIYHSNPICLSVTLDGDNVVVHGGEVEFFVNGPEGPTHTQTFTVSHSSEVSAEIEGDEEFICPACLFKATTNDDIEIIYAPTDDGGHRATLTLTADGADEFIINLIGTSKVITGVDNVMLNVIKTYSINGNLVIETSAAARVDIFTVAGGLVASKTIEGSESFALPKGFYLIKTSNRTIKFVL